MSQDNIPCRSTDKPLGTHLRVVPQFCVGLCSLAVVKLCALTALTPGECEFFENRVRILSHQSGLLNRSFKTRLK